MHSVAVALKPPLALAPSAPLSSRCSKEVTPQSPWLRIEKLSRERRGYRNAMHAAARSEQRLWQRDAGG